MPDAGHRGAEYNAARRARPGSATLAVLLAMTVLVITGACTDEPPLPAYRGGGVCYPVALEADPAGRYLYVVGANFDRAFRGGVVRVFDTERKDPTDASRSQPAYLKGSVEVGSYASAIAVQPRVGTGGKYDHRLLVASRDDDTVTAIEVTRDKLGAPQLGCSGKKAAGCPEKCSDAASFGGENEKDLDIGRDPVELSLTANPFGPGHLLHVVGTANGKVTVVNLQDTAEGAIKVSLVGSTAHAVGASDAITSPLTGRTYVSNSRSSLLGNYSVLEATVSDAASPSAVGEPAPTGFDVQAHAPILLPSTRASGEFGRGMALSSDGGRLYVAYRNPNSLVVVDIAPGITGEPANTLLAVIALGGSPARVVAAPTGPGGADLVYVSCFGSDDIWIVDPQLRSVRDVVRLPHSPYALSVHRNNGGGHTLYAALFSQHTLAAIALVGGLPPAGDASGWLKLYKTTECAIETTPEEVKACN